MCPGAHAKMTLNKTGAWDVGAGFGRSALFQPEGADCTPGISTCPPSFRLPLTLLDYVEQVPFFIDSKVGF